MRKKEQDAVNNILDALEKDQARIKKIKDPKKREQAVMNHNAIWEYAENLQDDIFDETTTSGEFDWIASTIYDVSGGMPEEVKKSAAELAKAYIERMRELDSSGRKPKPPKPKELRKRRISGSIGSADSNRFEADDEDFGADIFSPEDLTEINDLQDQVLNELADSIVEADDLDNELQQLMDDANNLEDPNEIFKKLSEAVESVDNTATPWPKEYDPSEWLNQDNRWTLPQRYIDAGWEIPEDQRETLYPKIVNNKKDKQDIDSIQAWLKDHPFNPAARNYEEREWADNEADGQAERYAPIPWEANEERSDQIDWDKLLRQANLTPRQKDDWELTDEELAARQEMATEKLGPDPKAKAERAQIWTRVKNGEGFREIAPDYPDYHWTLVRDMSRLGATEAGITKQQSQAAERAARSAARERAILAEADRLMSKMKNAKDVKDLKRRLRSALEEAKNIKKRTSNEYQMMRKKQVERWRLASSLFETMPEKKDDESTSNFAERLRSWFFETSPVFEQLAEDINHGHDISTATDRAYDFQNAQIDLIEEKLSDVQGFWDDIQNMKNNGSGGGTSISGSMGLPRGVRIANQAKAKKVDFRELDAIQSDIAKINNSSFEAASSLKRPSGLNKQESAIVSRMLAGKDFTKGFFKPKRKPKKA
jgi:hypothetical protein